MDVALDAVKWIGAVLAALGGPTLVSRLARFMFPDVRERLRAEIERNAELLAKLPDSGKAYEILSTSVDSDVQRLVTDLSEARRDPFSIGLGVFFAGGAVGAGVWAWSLDGWWQAPAWILMAVLACVGIGGIGMGAPQVPRDERGNAIQGPTSRTERRSPDKVPDDGPRQEAIATDVHGQSN